MYGLKYPVLRNFARIFKDDEIVFAKRLSSSATVRHFWHFLEFSRGSKTGKDSAPAARASATPPKLKPVYEFSPYSRASDSVIARIAMGIYVHFTENSLMLLELKKKNKKNKTPCPGPKSKNPPTCPGPEKPSPCPPKKPPTSPPPCPPKRPPPKSCSL